MSVFPIHFLVVIFNVYWRRAKIYRQKRPNMSWLWTRTCNKKSSTQSHLCAFSINETILRYLAENTRNKRYWSNYTHNFLIRYADIAVNVNLPLCPLCRLCITKECVRHVRGMRQFCLHLFPLVVKVKHEWRRVRNM